MDEQQVRELETALAVPNPDPETLPDVPAGFPLTELAIGHLARAILAFEDSADRREEAMKAEVAAWRSYAEAPRLRAQALRALIRDRLLTLDVPKVGTPFVTVSITKARSKIVVDDEAKAIQACEALGPTTAVEIRKVLVKAEFNAIFNAQPKPFAHCAHEEIGESGLSIRRRQ